MLKGEKVSLFAVEDLEHLRNREIILISESI